MALAALAPSALSHHSPAAYDRERETTVEGTVRKYEWANPHVYIYIEDHNDPTVVWQVEANPPSNLTRQGWSRDTLAIGEHVVVAGNPAIDSSKSTLFGRSLRKQDGTQFAINGRGPESDASSGRASRAPSDLTGIWRILPPAAGAPRFSQASTLPLTEKGRRAVESFSEESYPLAACMPPVAPATMLSSNLLKLERQADVLKIRSEYWWDIERSIHLNASAHDEAVPTLQGHSFGRWEGDVLVVDTVGFADYAMGNARELPSGPQKRLVERFEINPDRSTLTYRFVVEDPEYLTTPVTGEVQWIYEPEATFAPVACDVENARRFLED